MLSQKTVVCFTKCSRQKNRMLEGLEWTREWPMMGAVSSGTINRADVFMDKT